VSATLTIHRPWRIAAAARKLRVFIDGKEVEAVANGKSTTIPLSPGSHTLSAQLSMTRSVPLELVLAPEQQASYLAAADSGGSVGEMLKGTIGRPSDCLRLLDAASPEAKAWAPTGPETSYPFGRVLLRIALLTGFTVAALMVLLSRIDAPAVVGILSTGAGALVGGGSVLFILQGFAARHGVGLLPKGDRPSMARRLLPFFPLVFLIGIAGGFTAALFSRRPDPAALAAGFHRGCLNACVKSNPTSAVCPGYCDCLSGGVLGEHADLNLTDIARLRVGAADDSVKERFAALQHRCIGESMNGKPVTP
jgi:hypothetical protein